MLITSDGPSSAGRVTCKSKPFAEQQYLTNLGQRLSRYTNEFTGNPCKNGTVVVLIGTTPVQTGRKDDFKGPQ